MKLLYFVAFVAMCTGAFILFGIDPVSMVQEIKTFLIKLRPHRKLTMKRQIEQSVKKKEPHGIRRILIESKSVLELTHRTDRMPMYTLGSVGLFLLGIVLSALLDNYFLMPVLAVGLALIPWLYILLAATRFKRQLNDELETALSMITTSYLRTDNIITAIRENIDHLQYPVKEVFEKFLVQISMISTNIPALLEEMKQSIDNTVFKDWVDQIILCQDNRTLKSTLQPIVGRLSEVREVSGELNNLMYEPMKEFISMGVLTVLNFPILRLMSKEWYDSLMYTAVGQLIVAATFVALFISLTAVVRKTRPIEYRR